MSNEPASIVELHDDGVLWMLNTCVFHPRGFALQYNPETKDLSLIGDGDEVWVFTESTAEAAFEKFNALIRRHRLLVKGIQ